MENQNKHNHASSSIGRKRAHPFLILPLKHRCFKHFFYEKTYFEGNFESKNRAIRYFCKIFIKLLSQILTFHDKNFHIGRNLLKFCTL